MACLPCRAGAIVTLGPQKREGDADSLQVRVPSRTGGCPGSFLALARPAARGGRLRPLVGDAAAQAVAGVVPVAQALLARLPGAVGRPVVDARREANQAERLVDQGDAEPLQLGHQAAEDDLQGGDLVLGLVATVPLWPVERPAVLLEVGQLGAQLAELAV